MLSFFLIIFALPGLKGFRSKLLSIKTAILAWFCFAYRCLKLNDLSNLFFLAQWSDNVQFHPQYSSFLQLKYFLLLFFLFLVIKFWPFNIIARILVTPVTHLLINFALVEVKICCILLIDLSFRSNILLVIISKSLYKKSNVTAIAILSQMFWLSMIITQSCFTNNCTLANLLITGLLKLFGLLIYA